MIGRHAHNATETCAEAAHRRAKKLRSVARYFSNTPISAEGSELERVRRRRAGMVGRLHELARRQDAAADNDWDEDPGHLAQAVDAVLDEALREFQAGRTNQGIDLVVAATATIDEMLAAMNLTDSDEPADGSQQAMMSAVSDSEPVGEAREHEHNHDDLHFASRAVDNGPWDGPSAMSKCAAKSAPGTCYASICAGRKTGDAGVQSSWALPHHMTQGGAPNAAGVRNALSRLPQTQGLTNRAEAQAHLDAHMKTINAGAKAMAPIGELRNVDPERLRYGYRSMSVALRESPQASSDPTKPPKMVGNFAVFDEWTEILDLWEGEFMERIKKGAFANTFKNDRADMRVLFQHGRDGQLGSKALGTIESLEETNDGAAYETQLFRGLPELLLEGLAHEQYGASFRFETLEDSWDYKPKASDYNPRGIPERTLLELRVAEFGPVTFPAYKSASAALRSLTQVFMDNAGRLRTGSAGGSEAMGRQRVIPSIDEVQAELRSEAEARALAWQLRRRIPVVAKE